MATGGRRPSALLPSRRGSLASERTFIQQALAKEGKESVLPFLPAPSLFYGVVSINFDAFSLLFLSIVLWEAWKLPAPVKLR